MYVSACVVVLYRSSSPEKTSGIGESESRGSRRPSVTSRHSLTIFRIFLSGSNVVRINDAGLNQEKWPRALSRSLFYTQNLRGVRAGMYIVLRIRSASYSFLL